MNEQFFWTNENGLFYKTIVQWQNEQKRGKMNNNFEKKLNQLFLNDWKKRTEWAFQERWTNEIKTLNAAMYIFDHVHFWPCTFFDEGVQTSFSRKIPCYMNLLYKYFQWGAMGRGAYSMGIYLIWCYRQDQQEYTVRLEYLVQR